MRDWSLKCLLLIYFFSASEAFAVTPHSREVLGGGAWSHSVSCVFSQLSQATSSITWTKGGTDVTGITDSYTYSVDKGESTWTHDSGKQTTTLTVSGSDTSTLTFNCEADHQGSTETATTVMRFYTINASGDRSVTTGKDQIISCSISGLGSAATIKWIDPDNVDVPTNDPTKYVVDDGTSSFSGGSQTTQLTIKAAQLALLHSAGTYKCSVTSTYYPGSPPSEKSVIITPILVTAGNKEVLSGTDQVVISCQVTGITVQLETVKWTNSDGTDVTDASISSSYTVVDGTFQNGNSQTTTLTVSSAQTTADKTYTCLVTPASPDDATIVKKSVALNVYTVTSTPKQVTTAVDQTLTCVIGELEANGTPVTVTWKDPGGAVVSATDTSNYNPVAGTVDGTGVQNAVLTIKTAKLASYSDQASFTYKCSVQYSGSPASTEIDVVANVLKFEVEAKSSEVLTSTAATISCVVNGLTKQLDTVAWEKPGGNAITHNVDGYKIVEGTYDSGSKSQTTVLTIPADKNTADSAYTCVITSNEHGQSADEHSVNSNIFTITPVDMDATDKIDQTLTCNIGDVTQAVDVSWKDPSGGDITGSTAGYTVTQGTVDASNVQKSTLTITAATLQALDTTTPLTWTCAAKSTLYTDSEESAFQNVVVTFLTYEVEVKSSEVLTNTAATISCVVKGLTKKLDTVAWEKSGGNAITHNAEGYQIDEGTYDSGSKSQTTVLTIPADKNTADSVYTCVITSNEHGISTDEHNVNSNIFTITPVDMDATDKIDQTLTCNIGDVTQAVDVSWKDPSGGDITGSTAGYTVTQGTVDDSKVQKSTLTITAATLQGLTTTSPLTWTCAAKSTLYTDSEQSAFQNVVVTFLTYEVEAKSSEVLTNTAATISCVVNGLTKQLDTVAWEKPDGNAITDNVEGYQIDEGTYVSGSKSQTTVLTIPADKNTADSVYTCVITSNEHGKSADEHNVNSNIFTITPVDMDATNKIDQTLTCNIGDVTQAVDVSWKDPSGGVITGSTAGYTVTQGTVDVSNVQKSTLTITAATLQGLTTTSPLTWTCAAKSTLYTDSEQSAFQNVVVTFLTYEVEVKSSEVLTNTAATISCVVKGLTKKLDTVAWEKPDGNAITDNVEGYQIDKGTYVSGSKSQTTVLTIPADKNTADSVYTCVITSNEHGKSTDKHAVNSNIFMMELTSKEVIKGSASVTTCTVTEISSEPTITWFVAGTEYTDDTDSKYKVTVAGFSGGTIASELTVSSIADDTTVTCRVAPTAGGHSDKSAEALTFGLHAHDDVVLKGGTLTLSCKVDGFDDDIDENSDIEWLDSNGVKVTVFEWTEDTQGETKKGVTTLEVTNVQQDTQYTCKIKIDENWESKIISVDVFELTPVGDVISSGAEQLLARILVTGLNNANSASDKLAISWRKEGASEDVASDKLHEYSLTHDGLRVTGISSDETYKVTVSITVSDGIVRTFQKDVFIDFVDLSSPAVIKETGTGAELSCTVSNVKAAIKPGSSSWSLEGSSASGWNKAELTYGSDSQTITNRKSEIDYDTDEGVWTCSVVYELAPSIDRIISSTLNLDVPAFSTPLKNEFAVGGSAVTFTCVARSTTESNSYTPSYSWRIQDAVQSGQTSTKLVVTDTKFKDNFSVTCTATYSDSTSFAITSTSKLYSQEISALPSPEMYGVNGEDLQLTCVYSSAHSPKVQDAWQNSDGVISNASSDYDITEERTDSTLTTKLNIKSTMMNSSLKDKTYTCKFHSEESGENVKTFTIQDVFSISEQPQDQTDVTSGFTTNFSIKLAEPDSDNKATFAITYQWYKNDVLVDSATTNSYTTPQVFFNVDQNNKYSCEVTWTSGTQTLRKRSDKASITIIESCKVEKAGINSETSVSPTDDYVRDTVTVTTSCDKGYLLGFADYDYYSQTCSVSTALSIYNCEAGCYVDTPADQTKYNGVITFSDTKKLTDDSYTTIHARQTVSIACKSGYVVTSTTVAKTEICQSSQVSQVSQEIDLKQTCSLGCKLEDTSGNAVHDDTDNLIAQGDRQDYTCKTNTLTSEGKSQSTSQMCAVTSGATANPIINLSDCYGLTVEKPDEVNGTSSLSFTIKDPVLQDLARSTPGVSQYKCILTPEPNNSQMEFSDTPEGSKCIINNLASDTKYKLSITITFNGGATWNSDQAGKEWQFKTEEPDRAAGEPDKNGTIKIDIPVLEEYPEKIDVIAVWFKNGSNKNYNLKLKDTTSKRRKRSQVPMYIGEIYESYELMEAAVDKNENMMHGAFYASKGMVYKKYLVDGQFRIDPSELDLPDGESFVLAAQICEDDSKEICYLGTGTSFDTPPNNTVAIVVGVVVGLLVVALVASLLLLYRRRPDLFVRKGKLDDPTVIPNPSNEAQLEGGVTKPNQKQPYIYPSSSTRGKPVPLPPDVHEMPDIERRIPDPIHVADFLSKYRRLMQDTYYLLDREYDEIKCEVPPSNFNYMHAKKPENKIKNRFVDILPYDETRVKLRTSPDHPSDYVNACFVTNMSNQLEFIAAQGPKEETMGDFWQMIWENKSLSIVMVTNLVERGRKKCAQYWSDEGTMQYGGVRVTVDGILTFPDYCIRTLIVERGNERRCVYHFHYLIWPDHGAPPTTSLIDFCRRCFSEMVDGPVLVHCSAGVGRTGTLIALHLQMRMLADEQKVDLFGIVCQLRRCRKLMVQTAVQYKFLYQAVREMIICDDTFIAVRDFNQELARLTTPRSGSQYMTLLDDQFKRLEEYCTIHITHDKTEFKTTQGSSGVNHSKNRFSNVLPFDVNRVKLRVTTGETGSDYINASYINSYHERDTFIATQGPKPNTIGDFWRMIFEKEVSTIVMLTPLVDRGRERCTMYWPRDKEDPICVENITVHLLNVANPTAEYTVRTFSISIKNREDETTRQVKQYHYYTWTNSESPSSGKPLIKMIDQIKNQRKTGPVVVHCSAGIGRTAVFIAVHNCIEQLRQDEMIDLFTIVLRLRLQRNGMVQSMDQYAFCYRVMAEVCSMFDDYVNTQGIHG
ncbi:hypothetical protein ACHWQZ_G016668 [Mnemiopsis leidyi]